MKPASDPLYVAWVEATFYAMEHILVSASGSDACKSILLHSKGRLEELGRRIVSECYELECGSREIHSPGNTISHLGSMRRKFSIASSNSSPDDTRREDRLSSKASSVAAQGRSGRLSVASCDSGEAYAWFELRQFGEMPSIKRLQRRTASCVLVTILHAIRYFVWIARLYAIVGTSFVVSFLGDSPSLASIPELLCEALLIMEVFLRSPLCVNKCNGNAPSDSPFVRSYIPSVWLCIDIISAIPWHFFWFVSGCGSFLKLSLIRLVQGFSLAHMIAMRGGTSMFLYNVSIHPDLFRVVGLVVVYFLLVHLSACGYSMLAHSLDGTLWGAVALKDPIHPIEAYLDCWYWSIEALSFGNVDPYPSSAPELVYSSFTVFAGVFLTSGIVGIIASSIGRMDEISSRHRAKWDSIERFLRKHHISSDLRTAIREYYMYYNASSRPTIDPGLLTELSTSLRLKIDLCLYSKFIEQCDLFENCPARCVVNLIEIISHNRVIVMPLERIFQQGDPGVDMYFIVRGEILLYVQLGVSIFTEKELNIIVQMEAGAENSLCKVIARLSPGNSFGELALLYERGRAASAISTQWSEVLVLPRDDFYGALLAYPDFAQKVFRKTKLACPSGSLSNIESTNREVESDFEGDPESLAWV